MTTGVELIKELVKLRTAIKAFGHEYRAVTGGAGLDYCSFGIGVDLTYRPDRFVPDATGIYRRVYRFICDRPLFPIRPYVHVLPTAVAVFEREFGEEKGAILSKIGSAMIDN